LKSKIADMIAQENKAAPLRDEEISKKLLASGCSISRRTISKYRSNMGIFSYKTRKKVTGTNQLIS
jgi:RNA polymerase sigma-54 factor